MTKNECISKYGEEAWNRRLSSARKYNSTHRKERKKLNNEWKENNKQHYLEKRFDRCHYLQSIGSSRYCRIGFELIENYELAKADNFDPKKWHLHHRLENYWSREILVKKHLYYSVNPESLIWLPTKEHKTDAAISSHNPELSKWHKRILQND